MEEAQRLERMRMQEAEAQREAELERMRMEAQRAELERMQEESQRMQEAQREAEKDTPALGADNEDRTVMGSLPGQVGPLFRWPDMAQIPQEKLLQGTESIHVRRANRTSLRWVRKVVAAKWLPADEEDEDKEENELDNSLVMVKDAIGPIDVTYVEWRKSGYLIRVSQTMTVLCVTVVPPDARIFGSTTQQRADAVSRICQAMIRSIAEVELPTEEKGLINVAPKGTMAVLQEKSFAQAVVKERDDGVVGTPAWQDSQDELDRQRFNFWWRRLGWWTDGRAAGLYVLKIENGRWEPKYLPKLDDNWFEGPKYTRRRK